MSVDLANSDKMISRPGGLGGTVRTGWMAQFRAPKRPKRPRFGPLKCRWVSPGGASSGALDMGITSQSHIWDVIPLDIARAR